MGRYSLGVPHELWQVYRKEEVLVPMFVYEDVLWVSMLRGLAGPLLLFSVTGMSPRCEDIRCGDALHVTCRKQLVANDSIQTAV